MIKENINKKIKNPPARMTPVIRAREKVYPNREARRGFVMLFTVMLTTIMLAMAIGASNIALKEMSFSTSAKSTNNAFSAADVGIECVLNYDKSTLDRFKKPSLNPGTQISCANISITPVISGNDTLWSYDLNITGLGGSGQSCAKVNITKDDSVFPTIVTITSDGYNVATAPCTPSTQSINRQLRATYGGEAALPRDVTWKSGGTTAGVDILGNSLTKSAGYGDSWSNAGAISNESFSGNGYVEFSTNETTTYKMAGFNHDDSSLEYGDLDFAIYPAQGGILYIYEGYTPMGTFGTYVAGDTFRVAIDSGWVRYYKITQAQPESPVLLLEHSITSTPPYYFDSSLYTNPPQATIINAKIYP